MKPSLVCCLASLCGAIQLAPAQDFVSDLRSYIRRQAEKYYALAAVDVLQGNYRKAIRNLDEAIGVDQDFAKAYVARGAAKMAIKDVSGAATDYGKAISLDPSDPSAHRGRAIVYANRSDHNGSITAVTRALELDPTAPESYKVRGVSRLAIGDKSGGCADLKAARNLTDAQGRSPGGLDALLGTNVKVVTAPNVRAIDAAIREACKAHMDVVPSWANSNRSGGKVPGSSQQSTGNLFGNLGSGGTVFEGIYKIDTLAPQGLILTAEASGRLILWDAKTRGGSELRPPSPSVFRGPPINARVQDSPAVVRFIPTKNSVFFLDDRGVFEIREIGSRLVTASGYLPYFSSLQGADVTSDGSMILVPNEYYGYFIYAVGEHLSLVKVFRTDSSPRGESFEPSAVAPVTVVDPGIARFVPNSRRILTVTRQGLAKRFDIQTGREIASFQLPSPLSSLAFSPDGNVLASGSFSGGIHLWESATGKLLRTLESDGDSTSHATKTRFHPDGSVDRGSAVIDLSFSPDGALVVAARDRDTTVWDVTTGRRVSRRFDLGSMSGVRFLDGDAIVAASTEALLVGPARQGQ